jgi:hypothetical protein
MRIEEVLGREMTFQWFEGVALVQAVCRQLGPEAGDVFPMPSEVVLGLDGSVTCLGASSHDGVTTAARLLSRMLGQDVPVRLRLVVAQATGAEPVYPTLRDFSEALTYFERPDGSNVLQGLAQRASAAPLRPVAMDDDEIPVPAPPNPTAEPPGERPQSRPSLRLVVGAAVTSACVCAAWLGASAVGYGRLGTALTTFTRGPAEAEPAANAKGSTVGTGGSASAQRRGTARTPERGPGADPRGRVGNQSTVAERSRDRATRGSTKKDPLQVAALLPLNPARPSPLAVVPEYRPVFGESVEVTASEATPDDEITPDGARIYSRADPGVVPPRSVYPKLPSDPPAGEQYDDRTVLELVIGTNGLVERAKLRSIPRDIHEFMLVSAAKAWIFEPATVEGFPVRYRHRVRITLP